MNEHLTAILTQTVADTLEQLAFLFSFAADEMDEMPIHDVIIGGADFSGPFGGSMRLKMTKDVLNELTVNMLGMDDGEETSIEDRRDAFQEGINVICGNLLPQIGGKEVIFDISAPQIFEENGGDPPEVKGTQVARTLLEVDDGFCEISLSIEGDLPELAD